MTTIEEFEAKKRQLGPSRGLIFFADGMVSLFAYGEIRTLEHKPIEIVLYGEGEYMNELEEVNEQNEKLYSEVERLKAWNSELADVCDDLRAEIADLCGGCICQSCGVEFVAEDNARLRSRCDQLRAALVESLAQLDYYKRIRGLNKSAFCDTSDEYQAELREKARVALGSDWKEPIAEKLVEGLGLCHDEIGRRLKDATSPVKQISTEVLRAELMLRRGPKWYCQTCGEYSDGSGAGPCPHCGGWHYRTGSYAKDEGSEAWRRWAAPYDMVIAGEIPGGDD